MSHSVLSLKTPLRALLAACAVVVAVAPAQASVLGYTFSGVTGAGTLVDFGSGVVDASGVGFTITGTTTDVDLTGVGDGFGLFAATSTYYFGAFGSFTTDLDADRYFQDCFSAVAISCVGLYDPAATAGFLLGFAPVATNPDVGLAIGTPSGAFLVGSAARYMANSAGQQIFWNAGSFTGMSVQAVPEPATPALLGLGLAALLAWRPRRRA